MRFMDKLKIFPKKFSNDSDAKAQALQAGKSRDKTLRHSRSMPLLHDYTMDPETYTNRTKKPEWNKKNKPLREQPIQLVTRKGAAMSQAYFNDPYIPRATVPRPPTPTSPPTPPPKEPRKPRKKRSYEVHRRLELLDKFPAPPVQDLPDRPPTNLPTGLPESPRGGKPVEKSFVFRPAMRGPEPTSPLPNPPTQTRHNAMPVLGSRDGIPSQDLLPENRTRAPLTTVQKARQAEFGINHQRSASATVNFPRAAEVPKHREWDNNESRVHRRHHRQISNPNPPSKNLRAYMTLGAEAARREGPPAQVVQVFHQREERVPHQVDSRGDNYSSYNSTSTMHARTNSNVSYQATAPLKAHSRTNSNASYQPPAPVKGHSRTISNVQPTAPLNIRPRAGSNNLISGPLPLQAHYRNGSNSSNATAGHSSSSHHGHSSSTDSRKVPQDKYYPPSTRDRHTTRGIVRKQLTNNNPYLEFGYNGLDSPSVYSTASFDHSGRY